MRSSEKTTRILGTAFLLQFLTSISSGILLTPAWLEEGSMAETLTRIAGKPWLFQLNLLVDMLTAMGIILLGAMLYITLRDQGEKIALTALGFYLLEAALLAASKLSGFSLLGISREFVLAGQPADLLRLGTLAYDSMDFVGNTLHMLVFCLGGILFYTLLSRSGVVPRPLSLWGLVTVFPMLAGTVMILFGQQPPILLYAPYTPFEFVIAIWILVKGVEETEKV